MSTKNIGVGSSFGPAREIIVTPHNRHGGQQVRQFAAGWAQQRRRQDRGVLLFGAAAMSQPLRASLSAFNPFNPILNLLIDLLQLGDVLS